MGRRVLTATVMTFHEKYQRNAATYAPSDLNGDDLIDVFHNWAVAIPDEDRAFSKQQTWVSVTSARRVAPRVELLDMRVGSYGERGEVLDVSTGEVVHEITDDEAPVGSIRALLFVPEKGERAYFFAEESSRGSAGGRIMGMFKRYFSNYSDSVTMDTAREVEAEAWIELANLTEVEVRVAGKSVNIEDGSIVKVGRLSYIARPERGLKFFPQKLLGKLSRQDILKEVVSVPEFDTDYEVYVTMERDRRSKKFLLGQNSGPAIREVMTEAGEAPLSDKILVERCAERVSDLLQRHGGVWESAWSNQSEE
ncbi:hypothetical protein D4740_07315 [Actinomyces sp. 2119]|uniref:hypothetical protein n=1 Tax=Actinomyces sp. 2119 TaxID=2321393 RepID=UPI000E6CCEB3|nr:hypothetical protein [Actinomyces sp. 2119]RJF41881.1 hypothetical protein D4740_07315 [Actinomyces sp. 2119]